MMEFNLGEMAKYDTFNEFAKHWDELGWETLPITREDCLVEMQIWWDAK